MAKVSRATPLALLLGAGLAGCKADGPADEAEALGTLPIRHVADPAAAERGRAKFEVGTLAPPPLPVIGFRSLYTVWGEPAMSDEDYWAAFRERYGMFEAPYDNGGYPMGLRVENGLAILDCYTCHAGVVAGQVVIGSGNTMFDMMGLYEDLRAVASSLGLQQMEMVDGTGATGVNDAWGLGLQLANEITPSDVNLHFGYQRPGAWWTLKYKDRMYSDGTAGADGYRTMMAMLLAYGMSENTIASLEPSFADVQQYLWSLEAPPWPFDPPEADAVSAGREVFDATCARCHGVHTGPNAAYPDKIVPADEVGTDPARAVNFGPDEAAYVNAFAEGFIPGAGLDLESTGGYLAPPLVGIWARAPYFHSASVPDLAGVIDSSARPEVWTRTGSAEADYDPVTVGWKYTVPSDPMDASTREGRRIHDASRPGLSNDGHPFGDALSDAERADLLAYLVTL